MDKKTILITGVSRGVGYALANKLLHSGHKVVGTSRNIGGLNASFSQFGNRFIPLQLSFDTPESIQQAVDNLKTYQLTIDVVVHNAGVLVKKPFVDVSYQDMLGCYQANVFGPYMLTQHLLPMLSSHAHIVFISSMGGFQGSLKFPGLTAYSSSKAAEASLAECLQEEFKETDLVFNTICLGAVQTEMLNLAFPGYVAPLTSEHLSAYLEVFCLSANQFMRGKILPLSMTNP
jgi:NAD(P)-dependent dehydrogenase (short-subunit alcohol dehydrogenase family)